MWSVVYLSDGTIISGDSVGMIKLWDDQTGTLIISHNVTKCDVLALSVSQVRKMLRVCEQMLPFHVYDCIHYCLKLWGQDIF